MAIDSEKGIAQRGKYFILRVVRAGDEWKRG